MSPKPHRSQVYVRWALELRRKAFFRAGERVGVAVSGGPDSVLLLHFLRDLAREAGLTLAVIHFNHHLRGEESDADERFVRKLAQAADLDFLKGEADVAEAAQRSRRNLEATGRDFRYRYFFSLVSQGCVDKVATAHTANDQAETVLMRLLRGTGTRGLGGIYPVLEGKIIRPFLSLTRAEVLAEIARRNLEYRVDSTNLNTSLRRNKIRHQLLPLLEKEFNPKIVRLLGSFAGRARDDEAYLELQARERARPWRVREGTEEKIPVRPLSDFPRALARRVLRQMSQASRGGLRGIMHSHVDALLQFAVTAPSGKSLMLSGNLVARKDFDWLILGSPPPDPRVREFSLPVQVPGELLVPQLGSTFCFKIVKRDGLPKAYNESKIVALDPQKLRGGLCLRNWRAGDNYQPSGSKKVRKLKQLFQERKVPREQRSLWPVLECGGQIVWVRGFPPASPAVAGEHSTEFLTVEEQPALPR